MLVSTLNRDLIARAARLLDLQADGGDDPAAVLQWALEKAAREDRAAVCDRLAASRARRRDVA